MNEDQRNDQIQFNSFRVWKLVSSLLAVSAFTGCETTTIVEANRFDRMTQELSLLAARFDDVGFSIVSELPTSGSAEYSGFLSFQLGNVTDQIPDRIAGQMDISVDFEASAFGISGTAHSLTDGDGNGLEGLLDLGNGTLDRNGNPRTDATVEFLGSGVLIDQRSNDISLVLALQGDFFGIGQEGLAGTVNGRAEASGIQQNASGVFISEAVPPSE